MTKQEILKYVMTSPQNTNPAVLSCMLDTLATPSEFDLVEFSFSNNLNEVGVAFYEQANNWSGKCHVSVEGGKVKCEDWKETESAEKLPAEIIDFIEPIITDMFIPSVYAAFLDMIVENDFTGVDLIAAPAPPTNEEGQTPTSPTTPVIIN